MYLITLYSGSFYNHTVNPFDVIYTIQSALVLIFTLFCIYAIRKAKKVPLVKQLLSESEYHTLLIHIEKSYSFDSFEIFC